MSSLSCVVLVALLVSCNAEGSGSGNGCSNLDDDEMKDFRIADFIHNIGSELEPLGGNLDTESADDEDEYVDDLELEQKTIDEWNILQNTTKHKDTHNSCKDGAFYAKPVTTFTGTMAPNALPVNSTSAPRHNVLAEYTLNFGFKLESSLRDISRADLLLYQVPTITNRTIRPRDFVQFVEIRTLFKGQRHVVKGEYIDTFGDGFKTFEITNAVEMWLEMNVEGNVTIEVVVYCNSSPDCDQVDSEGTSPAKISFLYAEPYDSKCPRLIIVSNNPLENADSRINKRNSDQDNGPTFCVDEEQLCCLKPLRIYFHADLHMYNVLLPEYFDANYCKGICPAATAGGDLGTSNRYNFIRSFGNNHPAASLQPCCAGADYDNLDIVMKITDRETRTKITVLLTLHQVMVKQCRCG